MSAFQRLRLITAGVGVVAALVFVGTSVFGDNTGAKPVSPAKPAVAPKGFADDAAKTVYTDKPVLAFTQPDGITAFAWQLRPTFPATAARPKDVAVLIDTSASQAGDPMHRAAQIVQALASQLGANDRVDVWTLNLNHQEHTRSLTGGFKPANDPAVAKAADSLIVEEYAAGAVDMKAGVESVLAAFDGKAGRQQLILYVGDGESAAGTPMTEAVRVELGRKMADKGVQFFSVPLGLTIAANTLHGFGMLTGGKVVRASEDITNATGRGEFVTKLVAAFDVPVLSPEKVQFVPAGLTVTPGQLPPLRADRPTLVMGTLAAKDVPAKISLRIDGRVAGEKQTLTQENAFPAAAADHYFLAPMLRQWQAAESKDAPVVLPADRALAMAGEQFRLYRDEYVELALQAISADKLEHAEKLFQAALGVDPALTEAKAGVDAVNRIRTGKMSKKDFQEKVKKNELKINLQQPDPADPKLPAPKGEIDPQAIKNAQAAQQAADAEARALVEETIKRVRANRETDPDGAYEDLKRQRENVRSNDALTDANKARLVADLDALMRDVATRAVEIKRRNEAVRERISRARALMNDYDLQMDEDNRTKARLDRFRFLMSQARFELAYREAQLMEQERVNRGLAVPPEVYTTYRVGQSATQLREQRELKRLREDRYLLTLLQVEKSFVPYPDEPPVHFPPASVWRELRERRAPYEFKNQGVGQNTPKSLRDLQQIIEGTHDLVGVPKRVSIETAKGLELQTVLETLEGQYGKRIKFVIRDELFRGMGPDFEDIKKYKIKNEANLSGLTLGSFLDVILAEAKGSFIVRPEYIEITTAEQRLYQKVTRAFEIGDLALAVPNSINQQALSQNLAVFGAQLNNFGQGIGQAQQFGQLGNQGGQFGNQIGGGQQQIGGQMIGGNIGALGRMGQQGQMGNFGQLGCQSNLGVGGGLLGITGGQLGQFGNLGGQFGIQGNNQSQILIQVISQMVAPGEWSQSRAGTGCNPNQNPEEEPPTYYVKPEQLNSLGYYPVSNALIVRATSRYHPTQSFKFQPQAAMGAGGGGGGGGRVPGDGTKPPRGDGNVMPQIGGPGAMNLPATDGRAIVKAAGSDPKRVWNAAFGTGAVTDPNLVIAAVDFMFEYKEYQHAAESLKANLRKGHATGGWAYEALAIALQQSKATAAEVERAAMSAIDLDPQDPKAYLRAAKAEHDLGKSALAIDLCRRAADIEPNLPAAYANALAYADAANGTDVKSDVVGWATMNLLRRDWPNDGVDHIATAKDSAKRIAGKLTAAGRKDEAAAVTAAVGEEKHRDLIVELRWQGQADLDLSVAEPSGTDCTATQKRTAGGGVLRADLLDQDENNRSEVYTAAHAFNGKYTIKVAGGLGRPVGNKASVKVTRFAGTDKQEVEVFTVDLGSPKAVEITLEGGNRTELATVVSDDGATVRQISTATAQVGAGTGVVAGFGAADPATHNATNTPATAKSVAPVVTQRQEVRLPSASPALPGMRLVGEVKGGGDSATYTAFPVFTGKATDIPLPKLPLLPGSGK